MSTTERCVGIKNRDFFTVCARSGQECQHFILAQMATTTEKKRKSEQDPSKDDGSYTLLIEEIEYNRPTLYLVPNSEFQDEARKRIASWAAYDDTRDKTAWTLVCPCDGEDCFENHPDDAPTHGTLARYALPNATDITTMPQLKINRVYYLPVPWG